MSAPDDCYKVRVLDALRDALSGDELTRDAFQNVIRQFPITAVQERDNGGLLPPAVSLYSPVDTDLTPVTVGGAGVGRFESQFLCTLEVALFCGQKASPDELDAIMRRLQNYTDLFQRALIRNREDKSQPTVGNSRLWHRLDFMRPATVTERVPGQMLYTMTRFTLFSQRRTP